MYLCRKREKPINRTFDLDFDDVLYFKAKAEQDVNFFVLRSVMAKRG